MERRKDGVEKRIKKIKKRDRKEINRKKQR